MSRRSVFPVVAPCIAVALGPLGSPAHAEGEIICSFSESFCKTITNPAPGVGDSSTVTGSFITSALTERAGVAAYQLIELVSAAGWGDVIGLQVRRHSSARARA
jgi:hypothetical protein